MRSDFNPFPILGKHWRSVQGAWPRYILLSLAPGALAWRLKAEVSPGTGAACITIAGLTSALFLQLSIQIVDRAATWSDSAEPSEQTSLYAKHLDDLAANSAYGTLAAFLAAGMGGWVSVTKSGLPEKLGSILLAISLGHLAMTVLLVCIRTYHYTIARTRDARTGVSPVARQRAAERHD